jgi:hypothetical protein
VVKSRLQPSTERQAVNSFLFFFAQRTGSLWQAVKRRARQWTKPVDNTLVLNTILAITRRKSELVLENALLRQQLIVVLAEKHIRSRFAPNLSTCGTITAFQS